MTFELSNLEPEDAARYGELLQAVHDLFLTLRALGDEVHAGSGLTGAMPAILERLKDQGAETVPDIARARGVARQTVQALVNGLSAQGLVEVRANPRHRRSPLVAITDAGRASLASHLAREAELLAAIDAPLSPTDVEISARAVRALELYFRSLDTRRMMATAVPRPPEEPAEEPAEKIDDEDS